MHEKPDSLDELLFNAFEDHEVTNDYNIRLQSKLNKKQKETNLRYNAAWGFILAGFIAIVMYTSSIQYEVFSFKCKVNAELMTIKSNYNIKIINNFDWSDIIGKEK